VPRLSPYAPTSTLRKRAPPVAPKDAGASTALHESDCTNYASAPPSVPAKEGTQLALQGNELSRSFEVRRGTRLAVLLCVALPLSLSRPALAGTFIAQVVGITDGDTVTVRSVGAIRLVGIDAPEHGQPFAAESQEHLRTLVFGKDVSLDCNGGVSYGRLVCKVQLPDGEDVSLDQVKAGMAWHYKQYQTEQSPADRAAYAAAEDTARESHLGLWSDAHPIQPQDFRHHTQSPLCWDGENHRVLCSDLYQGPVRGNVRSRIYHWPGCPNYEDISEANRVEFPNAAAADQAGYRAARNCP